MKHLHTYTFSILIFFWVSVFINPAQAAVTYQLDDGSGEVSLGCSGCSVIWLNAFQAIAGGTLITDIDIAFGANSNLDAPADGSPVTAYIWDDPNNDGDPTDAVVEGSVNGTVQSSHTDTFINFVLPAAISLAPGEWFFVGFLSSDFAVAGDNSSAPAGRSWIAASAPGPVDPNNLPAADLVFGESGAVGFPENFLIRANASGDVSSVPVPMSLLLFSPAALLLGRIKRKQS